jgi:16S rRNA (cytosine967-C5)-methyltransferase
VLRPYGIVREQLEAMLESAGVQSEDAPLAADSLSITDGGGVGLTELGAFRQGFLHVQDPGATMVTAYASIPQGAMVADLCAAPGGKSFELARNASVVISSDVSPGRLRRVISGAKRLDARNIIPVVGDARFPAVREMDVTLIDVPCTGTGTFRRHPDARWRLKPSDLAVLSSLQRSIFRAAATTVKPGGLLVYSTCSIEPEENDAQVDRFLDESPEWVLEPPPDGAVPATALDNGRLRVLPQRHSTDGAFAARLRRKAG